VERSFKVDLLFGLLNSTQKKLQELEDGQIEEDETPPASSSTTAPSTESKYIAYILYHVSFFGSPVYFCIKSWMENV